MYLTVRWRRGGVQGITLWTLQGKITARSWVAKDGRTMLERPGRPAVAVATKKPLEQWLHDMTG